MQDLFTSTPGGVPLAERMRPRSIDEVVGQSHLLGPGKPLRVAFESGRPHSMILWGPPGVGKTTLARLMADAFALDFIAISAVLGGVKGAVLGAVIGGGGTIAATDGKEVELPQGTVLRVRVDSPVQSQTAAR